MKNRGLCETKFRSMLLSGTLTMAVFYIMMLSDSMIAGYFIGENGVAAINAVTPVTGVVSFFMTVISIGSGILYSREIGTMHKKRADEIYGQGLVISTIIEAVAGSNLVTSFHKSRLMFKVKRLFLILHLNWFFRIPSPVKFCI